MQAAIGHEKRELRQADGILVTDVHQLGQFRSGQG